MAIKRYPMRYVRKYDYKNPESGESEEIVFMANGYLFPLFKSLSGVELETALEEYKKSLLGAVNPDIVKTIGKFESAKSAEEKLEVVMANIDDLSKALMTAQQSMDAGHTGLSMIELLLITTRVCALPESDHAEALACGIELLPEECYQDPTLAFEILQLAIQYEENAKKNCKFQAQIRRT